MNKRTTLLVPLLAGALAVVLLTSIVAGQDTSAGKQVFDQNCVYCHGPDGSGGMATALNKETHSADEIRTKIRQGGGGMPAFPATSINDAQLADLVAYVQSLAPSSAPAHSPSTPAAPAGAPVATGSLKAEMTSTGHWHATRSKILKFTITGADGKGVAGLKPSLTVKTMNSKVEQLNPKDNGDGTYTVDYLAEEIGSNYAMPYVFSLSYSQNGVSFFDTWPVEVVRDGREDIMPIEGGHKYAYQVRYGWNPGHPAADEEVTFYFEPRRAVQTDDKINEQQPFRNTFNHITNAVNPKIVVESKDGKVKAELQASYNGLGIYQAKRKFAKDEVGSARDYVVYLDFKDPSNGVTIWKKWNEYPLHVRASAPAEVATPASALKVEMASPGHWHVNRSKTLEFTITDAAGKGVAGLKPTVEVNTQNGKTAQLTPKDNGDGTYTVDYTAMEIGSAYDMGYSISLTVNYQGQNYGSAWPVEVVRDGREDVFKANDKYLYQVRFGWDPGEPVASNEKAVNLYFEPRRSVQEGDAINKQQAFRNTFNHIPGLSAKVLLTSKDGAIREELPATEMGMGVYRAMRKFTPAEVGTKREYQASLIFTDPYNNQNIGADDNAYPLVVTGTEAAAPVPAPAPKAQPATAPVQTPEQTPASLPRTGDPLAENLAGIGLVVAALLVATGLILRRRRV